MGCKRIGWLLIFLLYVGIAFAQNLDDRERRCSISGSWGGDWPIVTKNTLSGKAVSTGHIHTLLLEYYIPYTRFSLKGGYTGEEIKLNPGISASLSNLEVGGRYYFLPQRFVIQPYGGLSTAWNLSPRRQYGITSGSYYDPSRQEFRKDYDCRYQVKEPLFTISPVIGADIYFLSCLAFTLEYNFRMGIAGRMNGEVEKTNSRGTGIVRSSGMRQTLSVGVKVNFPFTITQTDGNSILQLLDEVIFGEE